jgi:hypothetical protein
VASLFVSVAPEWAEARAILEGSGFRPLPHRSHVEYRFDGELVLDRAQTGLRHALWYSLVAGVHRARVVEYDKVRLRVVATEVEPS